MPGEGAHDGLPWWPSPDERRAAQAARRRARRTEPGKPRAAASRERTSPEAIVTAAVKVIDAEGLDALTIRRLAGELGVAPMTVYSYVRGKDELLDLIVDRVAADIVLPPTSWSWRDRARALAHSLRDALLAHPDGARLISERPMTSPNAFRLFDAGLGIFRSAGFPDDQAANAYFAFGNYVMGSVTQAIAARRAPGAADSDGPGPDPSDFAQRLPADQFPNIHALAAHIYGGNLPGTTSGQPAGRHAGLRFDFGLDSLLDGLAARLPRKNRRRS
jgi:AcrR family transcriptional regulator